MKNEKLFKVLDVVVKIAGIVSTVAQIIAQAFKPQISPAVMSQEDAHIVKDFMNEEMK